MYEFYINLSMHIPSFIGYGFLGFVTLCLFEDFSDDFYKGSRIEDFVVVMLWPLAVLFFLIYLMAIKPLTKMHKRSRPETERESSNNEMTPQSSGLISNTEIHSAAARLMAQSEFNRTHDTARVAGILESAALRRSDLESLYQPSTSDFSNIVSDTYIVPEEGEVNSKEAKDYTKFGEWIKNVEKSYSYKK